MYAALISGDVVLLSNQDLISLGNPVGGSGSVQLPPTRGNFKPTNKFSAKPRCHKDKKKVMESREDPFYLGFLYLLVLPREKSDANPFVITK